MRTRGCDFAWGVQPGHERALARALKRAGFNFVIRYLSFDQSKNLTRAEVEAYRAEGLDIVTVWESTATVALGGAAEGRQDAMAARELLHELGAPAHAPVYFAVDFDITPEQVPALDAYLDATAYVMTEQLNGVYGGYAADGAKHVHYRWQTTGWSQGKWRIADVLRQPGPQGETEGVTWDADIAEGADFGQWKWMHAAPAKEKALRKTARQTVRRTRRAMAAEPVLTAGSGASVLSALMAALLHSKAIHLPPAQIKTVLDVIVAVAGIAATVKVTPKAPAAVTAVVGTLATGLATAVAHVAPTTMAALLPAAALVVSHQVRNQVSPAKPPPAGG
jgi:hypothetical protein